MALPLGGLMPLMIIIVVVLSNLVYPAAAQPYHCTNQTFFTPKSPYHSNLKDLFSALSSNCSTSQKNGFLTATSPSPPSSSSLITAYGLFLCRGDLSPKNCCVCVANAVQQLPSLCPLDKEAIVWYDECMLRYSDRSIFSSLEQIPIVSLASSNAATNATRLNEVVEASMSDVSDKAAGSTSGKKYASGEAALTAHQTIYSLVQCTPDMSVGSCVECLRTVTSQLVTDKMGARVLTPTCNARFELDHFFSDNTASEAPSASPPVALPVSPPVALPVSPPVALPLSPPTVGDGGKGS